MWNMHGNEIYVARENYKWLSSKKRRPSFEAMNNENSVIWIVFYSKAAAVMDIILKVKTIKTVKRVQWFKRKKKKTKNVIL